MLNLPARLTIRILLISLVGATLAGFFAFFQIRDAQVSLLWNATQQKIQREFAQHHHRNKSLRHSPEDVQNILGYLTDHSHFDAAIIYDAQGRPLERRILEHSEILKQQHVERPDIAAASAGQYRRQKQREDYYVTEFYFDVRDHYQDMPQGPAYFGLLKVQHQNEVRALRNSALISALATGLICLVIGMVAVPVVRRLFQDNQRLIKQLERNYITLVKSMGVAIASRDSNTGNHCYRATLIALAIAEKMGISKPVIKQLIVGSLLHDVGKIAIRDDILRKPGRLTAQEQEIIRTHVDEGVRIVGQTIDMPDVVAVVASHHEKWDGTGYPKGLKGEDIPLVARIFAVADVFDSLSAERPYKAPLAFEEALAMIENGRGSHFDPQIVDAFVGLARQLYEELESDGGAVARDILEEKLRLYFDLDV